MNLYAYVGNDPVNESDTSGECGFCTKLLKIAVKGGDVAGTFAGAAADVKTIVSKNATLLQRGGALVSLATEVASPVSIRDGKAAVGAVKGLSDKSKTYQTYTKTNPSTGQRYTGRTSGTGTPAQNIARRDSDHHMDSQGYGPATLDKSSSNPQAIRGREQQMIERNGGAQSQGGSSGNRINGISDRNPQGATCRAAATKEFGPC